MPGSLTTERRWRRPVGQGCSQQVFSDPPPTQSNAPFAIQSRVRSDEGFTMMGSGTGRTETVNVQEVRELLAEIDRVSGAEEDRWANKRRTERRRIRVPCTVRYLATDGETVCVVDAHTRDVSSEGIGLVSTEHFARSTGVCVKIAVGEGKNRKLAGRVVYSRLIREGWYLSGVKFQTLRCPRLESDEAEAGPSGSPEPKSAPSPKATSRPNRTPPHANDDPSTAQTMEQPNRLKGSTRDRALRMLALTSSLKRDSRDTLNKVILLSASEDHVIRNATIPALLQIGGPEARDGLVRLLEDVNPQIQVEAAEALGQLNARAAIEPLKRLLKHQQADIALRVAAVLGRMEDRSGINVVRSLLAKDNPRTRDAVRTLGIIIGRKFRLNEQGIAEARRELKKL